VILRYEIEKELLEGRLTVRELPDIWDAKMTEYLDLSTKNNDKNGVMQDVHWPAGTFGYFPAYTLGSLMAAQFFSCAEKTYPDIRSALAQGDFSKLNDWLHQHVHALGSSLNNEQMLEKATGEPLNPQYFLQHVKSRYLYP